MLFNKNMIKAIIFITVPQRIICNTVYTLFLEQAKQTLFEHALEFFTRITEGEKFTRFYLTLYEFARV